MMVAVQPPAGWMDGLGLDTVFSGGSGVVQGHPVSPAPGTLGGQQGSARGPWGAKG